MSLTIALASDGNSVIVSTPTNTNGRPFALNSLSYSIDGSNNITIAGLSSGYGYVVYPVCQLADINSGAYASIAAFKTAFQSFFRNASSASNLTTGTLPDARLSTNIPRITNLYGNVVVGLGDSLMLGEGIFGGIFYNRGRADPLNWANILTDGKIVYGGNLGVGGNTSAQILARVPDAIALSPNWVILNVGTNDALQNLSFTTFKTNVAAIVSQLRAAGIKVAIATIVPSTDATAKTLIPKFNTFLARFAYTNNIPLMDWYNKLANPAGTGGSLPAYDKDGTHVNAAGGRVIGQTVVDAIGGLLGDWKPYLAIVQTDSQNLAPNGLNLGTVTAGLSPNWTKTGTGTGSVVTGDTTIVGNWQRLVVTDGTASNILQLISSGFSVGDRMAFSCRMKSGTTTGSKVNLFIEFVGPFSGYYILRDFDVVLESHQTYMEFVVPATTTGIRIKISSSTGGTNADIQIAQQTLINLTTIGI